MQFTMNGVPVLQRALLRIRNCCELAAYRRLSSPSETVKSQRQFLLGFPGGSVDLTKDEKSGIATIVLNNPERKNAFTGTMMVDLLQVVEDLETWQEGRGVLLYGTGGAFCSGGDLNLMKTLMNPRKGGQLSEFMQHVLTRLFHLPLISLALVQGKALGGGAEVTTSCDFRAFSKSASFGFVQSKLGVTTGWGGGMRLVELIGRTKALELLSTGVVLNSEKAQSIGYADFVVDDGDNGVTQARAVLEKLTSPAASPHVLRAAKRVVLNGIRTDYAQTLEGERKIFETVWGSPAHREALGGSIKFTSDKS